MALDIYNVVTTPSTTSRFIKDPDNRQTCRIEITSVLSMQAQSSLFTYISPLQTLEVLEFSFCHFFFLMLSHTYAKSDNISYSEETNEDFRNVFSSGTTIQVYQFRKLMVHFGFIVSELFSRNILHVSCWQKHSKKLSKMIMYKL